MKPLPCFALGLAVVLLFATPALRGEPPVSPELSIDTCFAPEGQCAALAIREINAAEQRILVNAYALTAGAGFAEALARAKGRGVTVEVIADRSVPCERNSAIALLTEAAIPVWIDHKVRLAHAKVMVIDGAVTLLGSYNWTIQASLNSEDLNVVRSPAVAAQYEQHWRYRRDASVPYRMREDWCQPRSEMIR